MEIEAVLRAKGRSVHTVLPWAPLATVVHRLVGPPRIGAVVVTGAALGLSGLVSERDVIIAVRRHGTSAMKMLVREVMATHVPTCTPHDSVRTAMMVMTRTRHRHLPVLDHGELVGIVSIGDLTACHIADMRLETDVLRDLYVTARAR